MSQCSNAFSNGGDHQSFPQFGPTPSLRQSSHASTTEAASTSSAFEADESGCFDPSSPSSDPLPPEQIHFAMEVSRLLLQKHRRPGRFLVRHPNVANEPLFGCDFADAEPCCSAASSSFAVSPEDSAAAATEAAAPFSPPTPVFEYKSPFFSTTSSFSSTAEPSSVNQLNTDMRSTRKVRKVYHASQPLGHNPASVAHWERHRQRWRDVFDEVDQDPQDAFMIPLRFQDLPWPITYNMALTEAHIQRDLVRWFVIGSAGGLDVDARLTGDVPLYAVQRLDEEIARWKEVDEHFLSRLIEQDREAVETAVGMVLDILVDARREVELLG
ncbi:hypothetical protein R3P38DRAFT_77564 [Favolaschia claudopus]|uniref:Uncharacterized protein n=1 Tax=Favolaschia claudopus TaxID=2862362 RepID=A0AAW0D5H7_9AGAR